MNLARPMHSRQHCLPSFSNPLFYRKAAHVLVLDKSISHCVSDGPGPEKAAENCLRIVGSATWMRRLWTLQGTYEKKKGLPSHWPRLGDEAGKN